jgi:co-chaperonin GroES (HSP10)
MIRPLRDRIVVRPLAEERRGLIEIVKLGSKVSRGMIVAAGPAAKDCKSGDVIQFTDVYRFPRVIDRGDELLILQEADICGIEESGEYEHAAA